MTPAQRVLFRSPELLELILLNLSDEELFRLSRVALEWLNAILYAPRLSQRCNMPVSRDNRNFLIIDRRMAYFPHSPYLKEQ